ncbi:MAG: glycosyltransferase family 4 protein [Puniceicoccales bacterium]|jgi:glycosyltransferase involved in cell wall biosynthesis|nr:glycosyltransferase family 4 protein [Puniceicoccales bacterium]
MIYFDVTKSRLARHRSGLIRVNERLLAELGGDVAPVIWRRGRWETAPMAARAPWSWIPETWRDGGGQPVPLKKEDWVLSPELFSEDERAGIRAFLTEKPCRVAFIFHDAIPLKHPHISLRNSVARHPAYMAMLAGTDRVLAVSETSRRELLDYWHWLGRDGPEVSAITLGADFSDAPRITATDAPLAPPSLVCVGIIEPRKNQDFLLDVCAALWDSGVAFQLNLVGRANAETGAVVLEKVRRMETRYAGGLRYFSALDDAALRTLYGQTRAAVFPTMAEGFGLPVSEALWMGLPCLCSDLPVLREQADGGGCATAPVRDTAAWAALLRRMLTDDGAARQLRDAARRRELPRWRDTAAQVRRALG